MLLEIYVIALITPYSTHEVEVTEATQDQGEIGTPSFVQISDTLENTMYSLK